MQSFAVYVRDIAHSTFAPGALGDSVQSVGFDFALVPSFERVPPFAVRAFCAFVFLMAGFRVLLGMGSDLIDGSLFMAASFLQWFEGPSRPITNYII